MRQELHNELTVAWQGLGATGEWWTGSERTAIALEARAARACALCRARKAALLPRMLDGQHASLTDLPPPALEAVHRIVSDPGRLSEAWFRDVVESGLSEEAYVELLSVVAIATAVDTFDRGRGSAPRPLPGARSGTPTRRRPRGAKPGLGWMPMLAPEDVGAEDPPLYASAGRIGGNVHRALSLVPRAMMQFWDLFETMYLPQAAMREHAQIEMLAARVAVLNQCVY